MRQALVGVSEGTAPNTTSITGVSWPDNVRPNDLALLLWVHNNTNPPNNPAGFTLERSSENSQGLTGGKIYVRKCDGSETGAISLTSGTANRQCAGLAVYRGFRGIHATEEFIVVADTLTPDPPSITPTIPDCAIVVSVMERITSGSPSWTIAGGYSERVDVAEVGSGGTSLAIADDGLNVQRKPQLVDPPVWNGSVLSNNLITYSIALELERYQGWGQPI